MLVYIQSIFLNISGIMPSINLIHISEIHAFQSKNQHEKAGVSNCEKKHSIAATLLYTPVEGGTAYAAKRTTNHKSQLQRYGFPYVIF